MSDEQDVEQSWRDPRALRVALGYTAAVIVIAGAAFTWFTLHQGSDFSWGAAVPGALLVGAIGAFGQTYRVWRARGAWPIWQGAGWVLLALALLTLAVPAMAVLHALP